jgi:hypothetical protein
MPLQRHLEVKMTDLQCYLQDGASYQARAVLMHLQGLYQDGLNGTWGDEYHRYMAEVQVSRWENCREQGYVCMLRYKRKCLNIVWFVHRNSDELHAVRWEQFSINAPTIDTADFQNIYKSKWDTSYQVQYAQYKEMAQWIFDELHTFCSTYEEIKEE